MDTAEIIVLIVGSLLIISTLWYFFGARDDAPHAVATSSDKLLYACPMHPWITSHDAAATCSVCGMNLLRVDEDVTQAKVHSHSS